MKLLMFTICISLLNSCYFFREDKVDSGEDKTSPSGVIGGTITSAGGADTAELTALYAISPAGRSASSVRPDPDTYIVDLLAQYRERDLSFARVAGRLDEYRSLLGGANEDFTVVPTETYDATSLLAHMNVAEEVCIGLVYPNEWYHGDWQTILPNPVTSTEANIVYLLKALTGVTEAQISNDDLTILDELLSLAQNGQAISEEHYVPVCTAILLDSNYLLF